MSAQQTRRRRLFTATAVLLATITMVAGCSSASGNKPEAAVTQNLTVGVPVASISTLDPFGAFVLTQGNLQVNNQLYDTLVTLDNGKFAPSIATKWESSADAKEWTFTLRKDVKFSDGSVLDATDVKASMERLVELKGPLAGQFKPITATVLSPTSIKFVSTVGQGSILGKLSMLDIGPSELIATPDFGTNPVGSGPFVVKTFDPGSGVTMTANKKYWGGAPKLDTVIFKFIPEKSALSTALQTGEIQLTWTVPDDSVAKLTGDKSLKVDTTPTLANVLIWFNSSRAPFDNEAVRNAIWQAVDFKSIIKALYPNTGQLMTGPLPDAVFGSSKQTAVKYDPAAAKKALTAAGFDFSKTYTVSMNNNTYLPLVQAATADWAKIGVKLEAALQEPAVGTAKLLKLDYDLAIIQPVITSTGDADYNLGRLYTCAAKRTGYCDPALDVILNKAGSSPDQKERAKLYDQAGKILWDKAVGIFPMNVKQVWAYSAKLSGVKLDPVYKPDLTGVYFTK